MVPKRFNVSWWINHAWTEISEETIHNSLRKIGLENPQQKANGVVESQSSTDPMNFRSLGFDDEDDRLENDNQDNEIESDDENGHKEEYEDATEKDSDVDSLFPYSHDDYDDNNDYEGVNENNNDDSNNDDSNNDDNVVNESVKVISIMVKEEEPDNDNNNK